MSDGELNNPMRFSIRNRRIQTDFDERTVTEIKIQDGQLYIYWEWSGGVEADG
jgi:hypothetical protein